jgi:hypothetical protein
MRWVIARLPDAVFLIVMLILATVGLSQCVTAAEAATVETSKSGAGT